MATDKPDKVSNVESVVQPTRDCAICLEPLRKTDEVTFTPCIHGYHTECINKWIEERTKQYYLRIPCPTCKMDISSLIPYRDTSGLYDDDENTVPLPRLEDVVAGRTGQPSSPMSAHTEDEDDLNYNSAIRRENRRIEREERERLERLEYEARGASAMRELADSIIPASEARELHVLRERERRASARANLLLGDVAILPRGTQLEDFIVARRGSRPTDEQQFENWRRAQAIPPGSIPIRNMLQETINRRHQPPRVTFSGGRNHPPVGSESRPQPITQDLFAGRNPLDAVLARMTQNRALNEIASNNRNPQSPLEIFRQGRHASATMLHIARQPTESLEDRPFQTGRIVENPERPLRINPPQLRLARYDGSIIDQQFRDSHRQATQEAKQPDRPLPTDEQIRVAIQDAIDSDPDHPDQEVKQPVQTEQPAINEVAATPDNNIHNSIDQAIADSNKIDDMSTEVEF